MAAIMNRTANNLSIKGKCRKLLLQEDRPGAEASEIVTEPCLALPFRTYQKISTGTKTSNAKNQGWPKLIFLK